MTQPAKLQSPGTAERLTPREIRLRQLAREQAQRPKTGPKPAPTPNTWSRLSDLRKGLKRLKGQ